MQIGKLDLCVTHAGNAQWVAGGVGPASMLLHFNAEQPYPSPFIHHNADSARQLYLTAYLQLPGTLACQPQNAKPGDASQS